VNEGTTVGQYRILRKIGEGGMGAVYLAEHSLIGRRAAIKSLLPSLSVQREIVDRFFNEARATTSIPDPGIVQVFDFGFHTDGTAFIVMEFLEGEPLDARIRRFTRLAVSDALRLTRQAAGSLAAAHARGIVHRDLKPENIFLVRDPEAQGGERPKILDFGIAKLGGDNPNQMKTRTGAMMGTPVYMSPEQCRGAGLVDHRSDIYALGCVLFHMLVGRPPFDAEGIGEIIAAHLREPAHAPSAVSPGIPPVVDELVLRCLAKAPDHRYQTMGELQQALESALAKITATGALGATVAMPPATPLAPGFRSEYPQTTSTPIPGSVPPSGPMGHPAEAPTTLGAAAGQTLGTVAPSNRPTWPWIAAVVVIGAVAGLAFALTRGGGETSGEQAAKPTPDLAAEVDAGVAAAPADAAVAAKVTVDAAPMAAPADAAVTIAADPPPPALDAGPARKRERTKVRKKKDKEDTGGDLYDTR
jgi:eukaryotic-like serine/threonine-protein kinase